MSSDSKKGRTFLCIPVPTFRFGKRKARKARKEAIQLEQNVEAGPTPTLTVKADGLAEAEAKVVTLEQENRRVKAEADGLAKANRKLEDELRETKERLEAREKDLADKNASLERVEKDMREAQAKKLAEPQQMVTRVQELTARLDEKEKLLKDRTTELNAAQAFLTRVDTVSEAEVVAMVDNLNTLISSTSGALQNAWDEREPIPGTLVDEPDSDQIRDGFGSLMFERIKARDSVAVNLAVQMSLGYFIQRVTSGWGGGQVAGTLGKIYTMISAEESQTIASRWRTLTKRYTPHQEAPQSEEVISGLARILMFTGSFSEFSEALESVGNDAGTEIKTIIEATLQLDNTIKTKIASCDMSVYIVSPRTAFSEETMTDEFRGDGAKEGGEGRIVAGTMEIGLLQRSGKVEKILRKPKVILEQDLVEPEGERQG